MAGDKVKFTCKKCGWDTSIIVEWADLRPKRCMNRRCNTSFIKEPDKLQIDMPSKPAKKVAKKSPPKKTATKKVSRKKKSASKTDSSQKASS